MSLKSIKAGIYFFIFYFCLSCVPTIDVFSELTSEDVDDRFYIKFDTGHYEGQGLAVPLYELSSNDTIGLIDCGIDKNTESVEDLYCILDLNEADIGVLGQAEEGIPIQYNVPREMCEYTTFMAPWHWNQRSGIGPLVLCKYTPEQNTQQTQVVVGSSQSSDSSQKNCYRKGPCPSSIPTIGLNGCPAGFVSIDDESDLSRRYCTSPSNIPYDPTTDEDSPLANCCFGKYQVEELAGDDESNEFQEWGGSIDECIGGPVRSSDWEAYVELDGFGRLPVQNIFSTWSQGSREQFIIGPTFQNGVFFTSAPTATYFDGIEDLIFTDATTCSNCPEMFFPDHERQETISLPTFDLHEYSLRGYPYLTLECLDSNFESLHRVHLIIREWNTKEEFLNFQDSDGRSGDPDLDGEEGGDCPYYEADEIFGSSDCNDFSDLDDYSGKVHPLAPQCSGYPCIDYEGSGGGR